MSAIVQRETRTLFERAWAHGVAAGVIGDEQKATALKDGTRAIRKIANVLGTESLRADLERAMRAMLGLINLHLQRLSDGDLRIAARSLADHGLLFHTRGASQAIKRILAQREGVDLERIDAEQLERFEREVVTVWAKMPYDEFLAQEEEAATERRRRRAAQLLSQIIEGNAPDLDQGADKVIATGLLILAYRRKKAWASSQQDFEKLLESVRKSPAKLARLPKDVPEMLVSAVEPVWRTHAPRIKALVVDADTPLHVLVGGDPSENRLHDVLALPDDALADLEDLEAQTTTHWKTLTGGRTDEERLLGVMLQGIFGFTDKIPFSMKTAVGLLQTVITDRPSDRTMRQWLEANAPHQFHAGLAELWESFWDERVMMLDEDSGDAAYREFADAWLPLKAARK